MTTAKDKLLQSMLMPNTSSSSSNPSIVDLSTDTKALEAERLEEEVSMLDMMMAAHAEARKEKESLKSKEIKKATKEFGGGFKKGFFGKEVINTKEKSSKNSNTKSSAANKESNTIKAENTRNIEDDIPTVRTDPKASSSLVFDDVQKAMSNTTLEKLRQGDWMTPDLLEAFQNNPIIAAGMQNPKCITAMQLMQSNPTEAKYRYEGDKEIEIFLKEFGKLMSMHFERLGAISVQNETDDKKRGISSVDEIGPLHAEALRRSREVESSSPSMSKLNNIIADTSKSVTQDISDQQVKEVLDDEELRGLLLDKQFQQIISECNDPVLFQKHLRDPSTAYKIKRLYSAGLLGVAK
mmetsp:Transcript_9478/g.9537  ORF Transcript_9478/g.9537 Transcript_9478/m.9537 type:complete len:352 (-) Transcript_9478:26-1081(-)